jgi:hypothetical protein
MLTAERHSPPGPSYEVEVDDVGPSLRNASAKVTRVTCTRTEFTAVRPSSSQSSSGAGDADPWGADSSGRYSDEPPL